MDHSAKRKDQNSKQDNHPHFLVKTRIHKFIERGLIPRLRTDLDNHLKCSVL
jgi:hypothetical protein